MKYVKPHKSFSDQSYILEKRGIVIENRPKIEKFLSNVNYYKLSGYFKFFENQQAKDTYNNLNITEVVDLYYFDKELRSILMKLIEKVEVSFKTQLAYVISKNYGPFGHTVSTTFTKPGNHSKFLSFLGKEEGKSKEEFVRAFRNKYSSENFLPIWMTVEILPFGSLTNMYSKLSLSDKKEIAKHYGMSTLDLESWLENIRILRNFCAHNGRVWNRNFKPLSVKGKKWTNLGYNWRKLSGLLYVVKYLVNEINPSFNFKELRRLLRKYFKKYPKHLKHMGFNHKSEFDFLIK